MTETNFSAEEHGARTVFRLAWPLTLKSMMLFGIVVIDALLVAPLGEAALAAMGLASSLGGLLVGTLFAFSNATQISLSRAHGSGDALRIRTAFYSGLCINAILGVVSILLVILFGRWVIEQFAHTPDIAADATAYLFAFLGVIVAEVLATALTNYYNAVGNTRRPLLSYMISLPINVGLSAALIFGFAFFPALGVLGAAIGSVVASAIRAMYLALSMSRDTDWLRASQGWHGGSLPIAFRRQLVFALPIAGTFLSGTTAATASGLIYAKLNVNEFAAMTLILPWIQFIGAVGMGWAQGAGIIVGQMLGANATSSHLDRFLREAWQGALLAAAIVAAVYVTVCLGSSVLYANLETETRLALYAFLPVLLFLPFPKGSNAMCGHTLRAGGDTIYVMNLFVVSQWFVRVPAAFVLVVVLEAHVTLVLATLLLEELVKFFPFHSRFRMGRWKVIRPRTD